MQKFLIIWMGQTASMIGSAMTHFAVTIWVWQFTHQVTALALFGFFAQIPRVLMAPISGVIVDRYSRKILMMVGDAVTGFSSTAILLLYLSNSLQIWHLYIAVAINGIFQQIQQLAYSATLSTLVPEKHYSRASSVGFLASYGASILAPALAGTLYYIIGLNGILTIDLTTFGIAIATIFFIKIPQPAIAPNSPPTPTHFWQELSFGFHYIAARPSLLALLISASLFWFAHDLGDTLYAPMILARTDNNAQILGNLLSAAGVGGVFGASIISIWGGPRCRIRGFLFGMAGAGLSKIIFGIARVPFIWIPAQFCSSVNFPVLGSSIDAIWLANVEPEVQGRVFATRAIGVQLASTMGLLIAGPLADRIFEPAMKPGGLLAGIFGGIFGTGAGAGMALLYVISAFGLLLVAIGGKNSRSLREIEGIQPDNRKILPTELG